MGTLFATEAAIDCNFDYAGYTICVQSEGSIHCSPPTDPCLSKQVSPEICLEGNQDTPFAVDQAKNGSIVSVFCSKKICSNLFVDGVAFNFKIRKLLL